MPILGICAGMQGGGAGNKLIQQVENPHVHNYDGCGFDFINSPIEISEGSILSSMANVMFSILKEVVLI